MIPFRSLAVALSVAFTLLFVVLAFFGDSYLMTYGVAPNAASDFITLRAAPMFLGLSAVFYLIRDAEPGPVRHAVCTGTALMFVGIALTGLYEYGRGFAGFGIVLAAMAELIAASVLLLARR